MDNTPPSASGAVMNPDERDRRIRRWRALRRHAESFVAALPEVPPFSLSRLTEMAESLAASEPLGIQDAFEKHLLTILIHNEAWRVIVAEVPFERRLLLLPQCLRSRERCPAEVDAYGLLCHECGQCPLGALQREAEELGYAVLIADGTGAATALLQDGKLSAVIGASCLPALEKTFLRIAEEAVPALAIPLLRNGCDATDVDLDWLTEHIRLRVEAVGSSGPPEAARSLDDIRAWVQSWFEPRTLNALLDIGDRQASTLAATWLSRAGKRWRPLMTAAVYDALLPAGAGVFHSELIHAVALATECFHKASLIHDDIEDDDDLRDGAPTLHREQGVAVALNVGDLLLGEGYGLLARCAAEPAARLKMLAVAADAHRRLCIGQGEELHWMGRSDWPDTETTIQIFRHKTSPAFEVAILLGAIAAGADEPTCAVLSAFSDALGIAYQIRDDRLDLKWDIDSRRESRQPPSILLAMLFERCSPAERSALCDALSHNVPPTRRQAVAEVHRLCARYGVVEAVEAMQQEYRARALKVLDPLQSIRLKGVLMRLVKRILPPPT